MKTYIPYFKSALTLVAISTCLVATPAHAEKSAEKTGETVQIKIKPKNLETQDGIERLYKQLRSESRKVCLGTGRIPIQSRVDKNCLKEQLAHFITSINHTGLTQYHTAKINTYRKDQAVLFARRTR